MYGDCNLVRRLRIAIDIDDVLAENAIGFVAFSNERWGTRLRVDDYSEHWSEMWHVDREEAERRAHVFHDSGAIKGYALVGAKRYTALDRGAFSRGFRQFCGLLWPMGYGVRGLS